MLGGGQVFEPKLCSQCSTSARNWFEVRGGNVAAELQGGWDEDMDEEDKGEGAGDIGMVFGVSKS